MRTLVRALATGAFLLLLTFALPVSAHTTPDNAPDTPLAGPGVPSVAVDNFFAAVDNSQGAINSLLRNPTCGVHETPDGIHPPGNP